MRRKDSLSLNLRSNNLTLHCNQHQFMLQLPHVLTDTGNERSAQQTTSTQKSKNQDLLSKLIINNLHDNNRVVGTNSCTGLSHDTKFCSVCQLLR